MRDKIVSFRATSAPLRSSPGWGSCTSRHSFCAAVCPTWGAHRVPVRLGDLHDGREGRSALVALGVFVEDITERTRKDTLDLLHLSNQISTPSHPRTHTHRTSNTHLVPRVHQILERRDDW